jgi:hypothetical protein
MPPTDPVGQPNRTAVWGDCHGVVFQHEPGDTWWACQWTAPPAGAADITLWYGVVDGSQVAESSLDDRPWRATSGRGRPFG